MHLTDDKIVISLHYDILEHLYLSNGSELVISCIFENLFLAILRFPRCACIEHFSIFIMLFG